ncbi:MAG: rod-binding protein [Clostridiales bacterium]|jgi:flagellar protein FlgJ|nr:rod-binding protein [Clostridiales bacterium]
MTGIAENNARPSTPAPIAASKFENMARGALGKCNNRDFDRIFNDALGGGDDVKFDDAKLKEACNGMEAYFIQYAMQVMRETTFRGDGLFAKSNAERVFTDMLYEEYAKQAAATGGIGIANMLYKQTKRAKESE